MLTCLLAYGLLIIYTGIYYFSPLAYVLGFAFGFMDSATSAHVGAILGFEFDDKSVIAFGLLNFVKSFFSGMGAIVTSFVNT